MIPSLVLATLILVLYVLRKHFNRPSLSMIRGPESRSLIFGNLLELYQRPVGETEFTWQSLYGNIIRFGSIFGEKQLLVADPKALQKILNTSAYSYPKPYSFRSMMRMITGNGLLCADGEGHKRQRDIIVPGFGLKESKEFFSILKEYTESLSTKLLDAIDNGDSETAVLDITPWLSRATLDAIGHAAFDVQFGTIHDDSHPLAKNYRNYFHDVFGVPSVGQIFLQAASVYIPTWILDWVFEHGSHPRIARARNLRNSVVDVAKKLVREKANALLQGKGSQDIFTLLVKANMGANAKNKLSDEELYAQMSTLLIAGHETSAISIGWILLELARNHNVQSRLRNEIRKMEATIQTRGDPRLAVADLAGMPYLNAVIKEGLRIHSGSFHTPRIASRDDVLPLSKPILTRSGDVIHEVPVPKGTQIVVSLLAYNHNKDLWGEDVHAFRPDRWLDGTVDEKGSSGVGVYSSLMTFLSGARSCPGWRFAIIELQAFLFELVGKFEFGMTDKSERIVPWPMLIAEPVVDGEIDRGVQMPLAVSLAARDGEDM